MAKEESNEPSIKWAQSEAKFLLLRQDILEGRDPKAAKKDSDGKRTTALKQIYDLRPEFKLYNYSKFSSRLSSLRASIKDSESCSLDDESGNSNGNNNGGNNAGNNNDSNNDTASKTKKNKKSKEPKIKWGRSEATRLLYHDIREERVPADEKDSECKTTMALDEIYGLRPELKLYDYSKFSSRSAVKMTHWMGTSSSLLSLSSTIVVAVTIVEEFEV
jgi:hypothetical protein